jgi:hypothetical protein
MLFKILKLFGLDVPAKPNFNTIVLKAVRFQ